MKTELTIEESAKLIELGVDAKLASKTSWYDYEAPIFTLTDLLSILPRRIVGTDNYPLTINTDEEADVWYAVYLGFGRTQIAEELIDALNRLLIWCITDTVTRPCVHHAPLADILPVTCPDFTPKKDKK